MSTLNVSLMGFPVVNKDLTVLVRDPVNKQVVATAQPFSDGTVKIPKIDPGAYELAVQHPNLTLPVLIRPIRILPGDLPTTVSVLIDPTQFRNTPIVDTPVANLVPIQQLVDSISQTLVSISSKTAGEAIRAEDWNALVSGVRHLADGVVELTKVVSPLGHNHPELEKKIDEEQSNFTSLVNQLGPALAELQRQINALRIQQQVLDMFEKAQAAAQSQPAPAQKAVADARTQANTLIQQLQDATTLNPQLYSKAQREIGAQLQTITETVQVNAPGDETAKAAQSVGSTAGAMLTSRTITYDAEIAQNRVIDRSAGGAGLINVVKQRGV